MITRAQFPRHKDPNAQLFPEVNIDIIGEDHHSPEHLPAGTSTLADYNLSLTSTNEFEVQINDSTSAIERRDAFLCATAPMHTAGSARCCCSGRHVQAGECADAELGCWILADQPVGQFAKPRVFWHLDVYPTRIAAQADKGPQGIVVESFGKVWLMTIEDENWRSLSTEIALPRLDRFQSSQEKSTRRSLWRRTLHPE